MKDERITSPEEVKVNCDLYPENRIAIIIGAFSHNLKVRIKIFLKSIFNTLFAAKRSNAEVKNT